MNTRIPGLVAILALALLALATQAFAAPPLFDGVQPTSLKGVELGKVATPGLLEQSFGLEFNPRATLKPCQPKPGVATTCSGFTELAGASVQTMVTIGADGTVQMISVTFQAAFFEQIEAAALAKWGTPTTTGRQPMQNAFGAQVMAIEHDWHATNGAHAFILSHQDLTHGMLELETAEHIAAAKAK